MAYGLAGTLKFNPLTDALTNEAGEAVKLDAPARGRRAAARRFRGFDRRLPGAARRRGRRAR